MSITTRKRRALVALSVAVALTVTACSSSGGSKSTSNTTAPASGKADPNGVVKVGIDLALQNNTGVVFDPAVATGPNGTPEDGIFNLLYGRFLRQNPDGTDTPDLAKSAKIVDPKTIEIVLRDGLKFSDGSPLDGTAVKTALERYLANRKANESGFAAAYFSLQSVEVVSSTTVRLLIPDGTAAGWYDQNIDAWTTSISKVNPADPSRPIGAGPMKIVTFEPGQKLTLTKNDNYWKAKDVTLGGYEFVQIAQNAATSGISALKAGQIDVTFTEPEQLASLSGSYKSFARVSPDLIVGMHICKREGPLANVDVRKAINKGIDRATISKVVFSGTAKPATQLWPTGHRFNDPSLDKELAYDPTAAKALLKKAGFEKFSVDMYFLPNFGIPQMAEVIAQELGAIGITVNIKTGNNYVNDFLVPAPPAIGLYPGSNAGVNKLNTWSGTSLGNVCKYVNPELDALITKLRAVSQSSPEAITLWKQVDKLVVDQALGGFLLFRSSLGAYNDSVIGNMVGLQQGSWIIPDPWKTFVKTK